IRKRTVCDDVIIKPVRRMEELFSVIAIDIAGPVMKSKHGFQYLLAVVDTYSRWTDVEPLKEISATSVCEALMKIFCRTSIPNRIISDNGSSFHCKLTQEFEKMLG